jgi:hypothetical protein
MAPLRRSSSIWHAAHSPAGARWTLRLLASQLVLLEVVESISHETVRQTLKKTRSNLGSRVASASHPRRTPASSLRWRTSSTSTSGPTIPSIQSSVDETSNSLSSTRVRRVRSGSGRSRTTSTRCGGERVHGRRADVGTCVAQVTERRTCDDFARLSGSCGRHVLKRGVDRVMDNLSTTDRLAYGASSLPKRTFGPKLRSTSRRSTAAG